MFSQLENITDKELRKIKANDLVVGDGVYPYAHYELLDAIVRAMENVSFDITKVRIAVNNGARSGKVGGTAAFSIEYADHNKQGPTNSTKYALHVLSDQLGRLGCVAHLGVAPRKGDRCGVVRPVSIWSSRVHSGFDRREAASDLVSELAVQHDLFVVPKFLKRMRAAPMSPLRRDALLMEIGRKLPLVTWLRVGQADAELQAVKETNALDVVNAFCKSVANVTAVKQVAYLAEINSIIATHAKRAAKKAGAA